MQDQATITEGKKGDYSMRSDLHKRERAFSASRSQHSLRDLVARNSDRRELMRFPPSLPLLPLLVHNTTTHRLTIIALSCCTAPGHAANMVAAAGGMIAKSLGNTHRASWLGKHSPMTFASNPPSRVSFCSASPMAAIPCKPLAHDRTVVRELKQGSFLLLVVAEKSSFDYSRPRYRKHRPR